jgi:hypothetical protein
MLAWAYTSVAIAAALLAAPVDAQGHHNRRRLGAEHEKRGVNVGWTYGSTKIRGVNIGGVSAV